MTLVQDLALGLVDSHTIDLGSSTQPVTSQVLLAVPFPMQARNASQREKGPVCLAK